MSSLGFGLYLLFMCSWFLHVPARFPVLEGVRADLSLVALIFLLCLGSGAGGQQPTVKLSTRTWLWALVIYAAVAIPMVEWPGSVVKVGYPKFFKAFVFYYFTATLVTTPKRLTYMLVVFLGCMTFRVLEPLYLHETTGYWGSGATTDSGTLYRLSGAPSDVVNPNGLAFIILTVLPFMHYLTEGRALGRVIYLGLLPPLLYALVLTGSRSGLVGLAGMFALVWLKSSHKVGLLLAAVAICAFAAPRLSDGFADRYLSLVSDKTENGGTVELRKHHLQENWKVAMKRPLFGFGLGTSREANFHFGTTDQPSHNLYIETVQEIGLVGLVMFLAVVGSVLGALRKAGHMFRQATNPPAVLKGLVPALQVFIGMNILFSFASYGLSSYEWYLSAGLTEVIVRLARTVEAAPAAQAQPAMAVRPLQPIGVRA
jgi:putative inorganic carbon (HCO3(-)) transporter